MVLKKYKDFQKFIKRLKLSLAIHRKNPPLWIPFVQRNQVDIVVLIFSWPRSGSTYLHTLLASHPNIYSYGEVPNEVDNVAYTLQRVEKKYPEKVSHLVFKYLIDNWHTLNTIELIEQIKKKGLKVYPIVLYRKNILENYYSLCLAEKTNQWSASDESSLPNKDLRRFPLSIEDTRNYFEQYESVYQSMLNQFNNDCLVYTYEYIIANQEQFIAQIQQELSLKYFPIYTLLIKQNSSPLNEVIINYEDLKQYFSNTKWSHFFAY